MKFKIVMVTVGNERETKKIARIAVKEKLAACATILPGITSLYWWEGKIDQSSEQLIMFKTQASCINRLIARVKELHSYTVPEVISLDIEQGNPDYLTWISHSCTQPSSRK